VSNPYCRFKHGEMLQTRGKFSKRDGGLRQYYHCRNSYCSYTTLEPRVDAKFFKEFGDDYYSQQALSEIQKDGENTNKCEIL
jgi:hypothetical protein